MVMGEPFPASSGHEHEDFSPTDETRRHVSRVLIIEDTPELAEAIQLALEHVHILSFAEHDGQHALRRYHATRPDVVILDLNLPDMTGWQLLDAIKETQTAHRRPAILVVTGYNDPANRLMGKMRGVDGYLIKPFSMADIAQKVQEALGRRGPSSRPYRS